MRKAGQLFLGDLITDVNGVAVRTVEDLLALVEETEIGSDVVLRVMRGADASKIYWRSSRRRRSGPTWCCGSCGARTRRRFTGARRGDGDRVRRGVAGHAGRGRVEDLLALVEETEIGSDVVLRVMRGAD